MKIQESGEDYLEAILILKQEKGLVRAIDVARRLEFSKPSVSRAVRLLCSDGDLSVGKDGSLELTDKGREIAERIYERHTFLSGWLTAIGVDPAVAAEDACRIEHVISAETFAALQAYAEKHAP